MSKYRLEDDKMNEMNSKGNEQFSFNMIAKDILAHKVLIISIVIIFILVTGLSAFFLVSPLYNTKMKIVINMPKEHYSIYGPVPITEYNGEYYSELVTDDTVIKNTIKKLDGRIDISENELKESISASSTKTAGYDTLTIKVTAETADDSLAISEALHEAYIEHIGFTVNQSAFRHILNLCISNDIAWTESLTELEVALGISEDLISKTQKHFNFEELSGSISGTGNFFIIENVINPVYTQLESDIVTKKQAIESLRVKISENEKVLNEVTHGLEKILEYYEGEEVKVDPPLVAIEDYVYLVEQPIKPSNNAGPNPIKLVILGGATGLVLGIGIALAKKDRKASAR